MKPRDSIHLSCASERNISEIITDDTDFDGLKEITRIPKDMLKEINCKSPIKSLYPLEYLLKFVKSVSSAEDLKLSFKDDYPLTIEFKFGGQGMMKGLFLLAPRTE